MTYVHGVLALGKSVPQLNSLIPRSGHDLTVVSRKSNGKDILGVRPELTSGSATENQYVNESIYWAINLPSTWQLNLATSINSCK